jgi:hypothetical protein
VKTGDRWVVDTNVAIVANGRDDHGAVVQHSCRLAAVEFLIELVHKGVTFLDQAGLIQSEYRAYLNPAGQPGVGDQFYQLIINSNPERVQRLELAWDEDGQYADLPAVISESGFDVSDRKFAALAIRANATVANAVDSDWIECADVLAAGGVRVSNLCGGVPTEWLLPDG